MFHMPYTPVARTNIPLFCYFAFGFFLILLFFSCQPAPKAQSGVYWGFIPENEQTFAKVTLILYQDGSFIQSMEKSSEKLSGTISQGAWSQEADTLILMQDGLKDQRWKIHATGIVASGIDSTYDSEHWKLWKITP